MGLETGEFITDLVVTNPLGTDPKAQGDDHIRLVKKTTQQSFPAIGGAVNMSHTQLNAFVGMVADFPVEIASGSVTGWLYCDGQPVSREDYAGLYALLGDIYGEGDGSTTFNVPDYRGQFLRAQDDGAGIDDGAATRTDRGDGVGGDVPGSRQASRNLSHTHNTIPNHTHTVAYYNNGGSQAGRIVASSGDPVQGSVATGGAGGHTHAADGGADARPLNVYTRKYIHI